jgi:hypothetical protein
MLARMPRKSSTHPLDAFVELLAKAVSARLGGGAAPKSGNGRRVSKLAGKKLDMSCRVEGCSNRSGGPRWGFICDLHRRKLSKKAQAEAREAWKARH